jgi:hypothetical protein
MLNGLRIQRSGSVYVTFVGVMSRDMAVGRVLGALIRIEENSKDIEQLPTPGSYTWQLTNGSVE